MAAFEDTVVGVSAWVGCGAAVVLINRRLWWALLFEPQPTDEGDGVRDQRRDALAVDYPGQPGAVTRWTWRDERRVRGLLRHGASSRTDEHEVTWL